MANSFTEKELLYVTQIAYYNFDPELIDELKSQNDGENPTLQEILQEDFNHYLYGKNKEDTIYAQTCVNEAEAKPEEYQGDSKKEERHYENERSNAAKNLYNAIKDGNMYADWTLVDFHDENDSTGMVACMLDAGDGRAVIGFRGSESDDIQQIILDWVFADLLLLNSHETLQQHRAELYMEELYEKYGDQFNYWATSGHSLGGALSFHAALTAPQGMWEKIGQSYSMDGPHTSNEYITTHKDYILRMEQHPDVMQHRGWSLVGNILNRLPCANYKWASVRDEMVGDSWFMCSHKHDTCSVMFDEEDNMVCNGGNIDPYTVAFGCLTTMIDSFDFDGIIMRNAQIHNVIERMADVIRVLTKEEPELSVIGMLSEHNLESEEDIVNFLKEHTENEKQEYLVRGALLRCRYGTHARQLNLKKCHGVYAHKHPCIHAQNCLVGDEENITWYGVCRAPEPPPTEVVYLTKDVPRNPKTGDRTGDAPGGHESGHKCRPEIVGAVWMDANEQTRIVDNGDLDPTDRARVQSTPENFSELTDEEQAELLSIPEGIPTTSTISFLICKYGGLIEPYNSGQQYEPDEPLD